MCLCQDYPVGRETPPDGCRHAFGARAPGHRGAHRQQPRQPHRPLRDGGTSWN